MIVTTPTQLIARDLPRLYDGGPMFVQSQSSKELVEYNLVLGSDNLTLDGDNLTLGVYE